MRDYYLIGIDDAVVGADQHVAIQFKDAAAVIAKEGGKLGALAHRIAPEAVESEVYRRTMEQIDRDLRSRGLEADVRVVTGPPGGGGKIIETRSGGTSGAFWRGAGAGAGGAALLYILFRILRGIFK